MRSSDLTMSTRDWGLAAAAGALLLDQATKLILLFGYGFKAGIPPDFCDARPVGFLTSVRVLPFFNLSLVPNCGISYGLFQVHGLWGVALLVFIAFLAVVALGIWLWRTADRVIAIGLGLIIGGAIGNNLVDRPIYGWVADFFDFHAFGYHWYVFNVADAAITFGVIALLYDAMMRPAGASQP
jgi:signal peptidase II